jgi:hypothetical protein
VSQGEEIVELHLAVGKIEAAYAYEEIRVEVVAVPKKIDVITDRIKIVEDKVIQLKSHPHA